MASTSSTKNAQYAVNFFKSKGWTDAQAAGIVGNLQAESGVDLNYQATNGNAIGIAQWLTPARKTAFQQQYGVPISQSSFDQQLDFVNWELNNTEKAAGIKLKATNTAAGAAEVIFNYYERPGDNSLNKRVQFAQILSGGVPEGVLSALPADRIQEDIKKSGIYMINNVPPIPNRLHNYSTYIYSLSLHMLTNEEYNTCVQTQKYIPKNVIISSAGRYNNTQGTNQFIRNKFFDEDFYFKDLELLTLIAPNDISRNSNGVDVNFTIIEPYGFTLVERIINAASSLGNSHYLNVPYLLQIDFFAVDDAGNLVGALQELQKRMILTMNKMDVDITERGAEYRINGTPFGHKAFEKSTVTVPCNIEVTAKTVADFFQSVEGTPDDTYLQDLNNKVDLQQRQQTDLQTAQSLNAPTLLFNSLNRNATINADSFGTAINDYWKAQVANKKAEIGDVYRFEFLPDPDTGQDLIGSATFVEESRNTPKETPMKIDGVKMALSSVGENQNIYDTTRAIFTINYGTTIERLLEYVIRNSTYIHDQLIIPDGVSQQEYQARKEELKDKPLKWFRIIPKVRLLGKDNIRNCYAKEVTYTVKPYKMYNVKSDLAPRGIVVAPVKNYNYIFTGKNDDVIDVDLKFNMVYYSQTTAYRNLMSKTAPKADSYSEDFYVQNAPNYTGGTPSLEVNPNAVMPLVTKTVASNSIGIAAGNPNSVKEIASADLAESLMTSSDADMVGVKLRILGDPDYIKQDDIFYQDDVRQQINVPTNLDERLLANGGSLKMDDGGVYVQILFKVPRDLDDQTGFMKYDAGMKNSLFSGLYQVIQVVSTFSDGKFIQELDLVRLPRQIAFDYVGSNNTKSNARVATSTVPGVLGITVEPPVIPSILQSGNTPLTSPADAADTTIDQTPGQDQEAAQLNNAELPPLTNEQQDLATVRDSAPTTSINDQNQTPPIPYPQAPDVPSSNQSQVDTLQRDIYYQTQLIESNDRQLNLAQQRYDAYIAEDPSQSQVRTRLALTTLTRLNNQNSTLLDEKAALEEQLRQARQ